MASHTAWVETADEMRRLGAEWSSRWQPGDIVLLEGELGAGKTTFVRGVLEAKGVREPVRSPTFNLVQQFETNPPILHADLYRVTGPAGLGLEDFVDTHVLFVEWPDRLGSLIDPERCWRVEIEFAGSSRVVRISGPAR